MAEYDIVIAGAGHNGLGCGVVLAKHGLKVCVVEQAPYIGGGAVTREIVRPGFKNDTHSWGHMWIHSNPHFAEVKPELEERFGLKYIMSEGSMMAHPFPDNKALIYYKSIDETCANFAQFSEKDARRYREIFDFWVHLKDGFTSMFYSPPHTPSEQYHGLDQTEDGNEFMRYQQMSVKDFVMENFESEYVRTALLCLSLAPNNRPDQDGLGILFFIMIPHLHTYGEGIPQGGSGELSASFARMIEGYGGTVMVNSPVTKFIVENGQCKGVEIADGNRIYAKKAVVTNIDLKHTFLELTDREQVPPRFRDLCQHYKPARVPCFSSYYALNEAPKLKAGAEATGTGYWRICDWREDLEYTYEEIAQGKLPANPHTLGFCATMKDPTRAPEGKHTLLLYSFVPYRLSDGSNWDDVKDKYADSLLEKFRRYTTNMGDGNIIGRYVNSPVDIERENPCMLEGGNMGGEMDISQLLYFRPFPGYSHYRSPIKSLYMVGPYTHPGGGVTAGGMIVGKEVLYDLGMLEREI